MKELRWLSNQMSVNKRLTIFIWNNRNDVIDITDCTVNQTFPNIYPFRISFLISGCQSTLPVIIQNQRAL